MVLSDSEKIWYVYFHIKDGEDKPFYVGIGKKKNYKRAFVTSGRNRIWNNIHAKYGCYSSVIYDNLSQREACEIEVNLISFYGRIDLKTGVLSNLTNGGEGNCGVVFSKERIEKIRISQLGKKHRLDTIEKFKQRKQTQETKDKIRASKTGIKATDETRAKMRMASMGKNNPACISRRKMVVDVVTGQTHESITQAASVSGISKSYLIGMLNGRYMNNTNFRYVNPSN